MPIAHDLTPLRPDYAGGSIVNLMASLGNALGAAPAPYAELTALPAAEVAAARRVALVVIDGLGAELLEHLDGAGALSARRRDTMTSVYPPTTASAITTFMSGLAPQQHGLTGWFMHFRRLGAVTAVLPFMPRYARHGLAGQGVAPAALIDAPSFAAGLPCAAAALLPADLAESDFSRLLGAGARRDGYQGLEDFVARVRRFVGGDDDARYLYAYWPDLDREAHLQGPSSTRVARHFAALQAALAPLLELAAGSGTLLLVTADHGFVDSPPQLAVDLDDHAELAAMLSLPLCGEPRSAYAYVRPRATAAFEDYVRDRLDGVATLVASEDLIADGWYGPGPAHPELAARCGDYVLQMKGCHSLRDSVVGERPFALHGHHGGISTAEQRVPLLVAGP
ncbi:MAG: alkaline phosphatase family protein [Gammaproteobacteria bacterium]